MAFYADLDVEDSLSVFLLTNRYKSENICLIFEKKDETPLKKQAILVKIVLLHSSY